MKWKAERVFGLGLAMQTDLWEINLYDIIPKTISPAFRQCVQHVKGVSAGKVYSLFKLYAKKSLTNFQIIYILFENRTTRIHLVPTLRIRYIFVTPLANTFAGTLTCLFFQLLPAPSGAFEWRRPASLMNINSSADGDWLTARRTCVYILRQQSHLSYQFGPTSSWVRTINKTNTVEAWHEEVGRQTDRIKGLGQSSCS